MAIVNAKVLDFNLNTSTGNQTITGVGFTPKAIIFLTNPNTADIDSPDLTANVQGGIGFTDGVNQGAMAWFSPNGAALEVAYLMQATNRVILGMVNGSQYYGASIVSFNSDGFTINVDNAPGLNYRVGCLVLGGSDLSAFVGTTTAKTGTTGSVATTGVGFQPTALMAATLGNSAAYSATTINQASVELAVGVSDGTTDRCNANWLRNGEVSVSNRMCQSATDFLKVLNADTPAYDFICDVTSLDADGFTLNYTDVGDAAKIIYLALGGMSTKVFGVQMPTTVGTVNTTGVGFTPVALWSMSVGRPNHNPSGNNDGAKMTVGFATADDERYSIGWTSEDGTTGATDDDNYQHNDHLGRIGDFAQATEEEWDFNSFNSDGFDIDAEVVIGANASAFHYLAIEGGFDSGGGGSEDNSPDAGILFKLL